MRKQSLQDGELGILVRLYQLAQLESACHLLTLYLNSHQLFFEAFHFIEYLLDLVQRIFNALFGRAPYNGRIRAISKLAVIGLECWPGLNCLVEFREAFSKDLQHPFEPTGGYISTIERITFIDARHSSTAGETVEGRFNTIHNPPPLPEHLFCGS